jgi:hypothetical protein
VVEQGPALGRGRTASLNDIANPRQVGAAWAPFFQYEIARSSSLSERCRSPFRQLPKQLMAVPMGEARDGHWPSTKLKAG